MHPALYAASWKPLLSYRQKGDAAVYRCDGDRIGNTAKPKNGAVYHASELDSTTVQQHLDHHERTSRDLRLYVSENCDIKLHQQPRAIFETAYIRNITADHVIRYATYVPLSRVEMTLTGR